MKPRRETSSKASRKIRPALNPEAKENQMVSLAMDLVEQRLLNGSASSQETTHFLKIGSSKYKYERKLIETQSKLLEAKTEALESAKKNEELYGQALNAFRIYSGQDVDDETSDDEEDENNF